jgi:hypothetical protein
MFARSSIPSLSQAVACLFVLGGCATTDLPKPGQGDAGKTATAVPANYRQLVARKVAQRMVLRKVLKAEISLPGEGWMGLTRGGTRPIVCAKLIIQGPVIQQTIVAGFTFRNGEIEEMFHPGIYNPVQGAIAAALESALTCDKLSYSAFPELLRPS